MGALGPQAKYEEIASFYDGLLRRPDAPELLNTWLECLCSAGMYLAAGWAPRYNEEILAYLQVLEDKLEPTLIGRMERAAAKGGEEAEVDQAGEAITGGASGSADVRGDRAGGCSFGATDELQDGSIDRVLGCDSRCPKRKGDAKPGCDFFEHGFWQSRLQTRLGHAPNVLGNLLGSAERVNSS
jgi:hypothetical protein